MTLQYNTCSVIRFAILGLYMQQVYINNNEAYVYLNLEYIFHS
jgi:hypothetical protein